MQLKFAILEYHQTNTMEIFKSICLLDDFEIFKTE